MNLVIKKIDLISASAMKIKIQGSNTKVSFSVNPDVNLKM